MLRNAQSLETLLGDWRLIALGVGLLGIFIAVIVSALQLIGAIEVPFAATWKDVIAGFIPLVVTVIAFSTLVILVWALRSQFNLRAREIEHEAALVEADVVRRQGELAQAIRFRLAGDFGDTEAERRALAEELETATERYHTVLRGFIRARPDIARIERDAIVAYLAEADAELRRMNAPGYESLPETTQELPRNLSSPSPADEESLDSNGAYAPADIPDGAPDAPPARQGSGA